MVTRRRGRRFTARRDDAPYGEQASGEDQGNKWFHANLLQAGVTHWTWHAQTHQI